ncbi:MAG: hypothetical protein JJE22_18425 [Bacteroidia bacterium]|nr:hypothetical protein [Bacteroidia bacterium]
MQTLQKSFTGNYVSGKEHSLSDVAGANHFLLSRFISWCKSQGKNRFGWVAVIIISHGCVITPLTLFAIILAGNNFLFWGMATAAMGMSLVSNLAALPTKITIPIYFLSLVIDLVIVINCIFIWLTLQ